MTYDREFEAYFEGGHEKYPSWRFMREEIGRICGNDVTVERITSSELLLLGIPEFCVKLANPVLDAINKKVTFDVKAKSNIAGLEFARADIPLKYPQELLGSNIVLNGKVEAVKAESTNTSFYDLNIHDIVDDKFMLTLSSSCNGGESGFVLGTEFEKIAKVTVEVLEYGDLGTINGESFDVDGFAKYFLDGVCQEFVEKCVVGQVSLVACTVNGILSSPTAAGIGEKLTITGSHFTDLPILTQMIIPDADNGGQTSIFLSGASNHFKPEAGSIEPSLWTDSKIEMYVSSTVNSLTNLPSEMIGSGDWEIRPDGNKFLPCHVSVEINYNLYPTYRFNEFRTFSLAKKKTLNPDGKYNWNIIAGIDSDPILMAKGITFDQVEAVAKAVFCDWEKATGIDFEYTGTVSSRDPSDGQYTLFFNSLGATTLIATHAILSPNSCNSDDKYFGGRIKDGDIEINTDIDWFINLSSSGIVGTGKYDLYSVLLHEIGHSLGLDHAMDMDMNNGVNDMRIMYWGFATEQVKRVIDSKSSDGIKWLKDETENSINSPDECFPASVYSIHTVPASAWCLPVSNIVTLDKKCNISINNIVYQGEVLNVFFKSNEENRSTFLFNSIGALVWSNKGNKDLFINTSELGNGVFYLATTCNLIPRIFKIIII